MDKKSDTDTFAVKFKTTCGEKEWVPIDISRKLENERNEAREKYTELLTQNMLAINKIYNERDKLKQALIEVLEQTDGRNPSHIGQDRAYSIALAATKTSL